MAVKQVKPDLRYPVLEENQIKSWIPPVPLDWYIKNGVSIEKLQARIQWIFAKDEKITIQWLPGGLDGGTPETDAETRKGNSGCCSCEDQDYWFMGPDSRPPAFGFSQYSWMLYRGLKATATVHKDVAVDKLVVSIPI